MLQKIKSFKNKLLFQIHINSFVEDLTTGECGIPVILSKINTCSSYRKDDRPKLKYIKLFRLRNTFRNQFQTFTQLFHDGGPYHIETSPLNCSLYQWTSLYMIGTSVMKKLSCK